jgi:hypothetical protein
MNRALTWPAVALTFASMGAGAVIAYRATALDPEPFACRRDAKSLARLELLFGMGRKDGTEIDEREWRAFLDKEVTQRFPDGLTVLTGYGQWRNSSGVIAKETSRMLIIWHRSAADTDGKVEAIRAAYKAQFAQESVMRVDGVSCVSF